MGLLVRIRRGTKIWASQPPVFNSCFRPQGRLRNDQERNLLTLYADCHERLHRHRKNVPGMGRGSERAEDSEKFEDPASHIYLRDLGVIQPFVRIIE